MDSKFMLGDYITDGKVVGEIKDWNGYAGALNFYVLHLYDSNKTKAAYIVRWYDSDELKKFKKLNNRKLVEKLWKEDYSGT